MTGLTPWDVAGLGTSLVGGILAQNQANKQFQFDKQKYEDEKRQLALQNMLNAQIFQANQEQQNRQQNLAGLNFLANMRGENQQLARQRSFRDNLLKAGV